VDVEIEDSPGWPIEIRRITEDKRDLTLLYQRERQRIDHLCEDNIHLRINRPANIFKSTYDVVVSQLQSELRHHRLIAFHCTRITPSEITDVERNGLKQLSAVFVRDRLARAVREGYMSQTEHDELLRSKFLASSLSDRVGRRTGMIWFCPNRSQLRHASGVHRLFRSWGGEAVYWGHEDDPRIGEVLARIGTPCIVRCAIELLESEQSYFRLAERFLAHSIVDECEYPEPPPDFDLRIRRDVRPSEILEVINFANSRFEQLTNCSKWPRERPIDSASTQSCCLPT
jgi:hypothetical protein